MSKNRVLAINTSSDRGGAALTSFSIGGNEIQRDFICYDKFYFNNLKIIFKYSFIIRYLNIFFYRILGVSAFSSYCLWGRLITLIKFYKIIHLHNIHGYYLPIFFLKKIFNNASKVVITFHDYHYVTGGLAYVQKNKPINFCKRLLLRSYPFELFDKSRIRKKIYMDLFLQFDPVIITPSHTMISELKNIGFNYKNIHVIYNGIFDNEDFLIQKKRNEITKFLFVANKINDDIKGIKVLYESLNFITNYKFEIHIIGEGSPLCFDPRVLYLGKMPFRDVLLHMESYDAYISPSFNETFGRTVIEARGMALTVICSDIPIYKEVLSNDALFFDVGNPKSLADSIKYYLNNPPNLQSNINAAIKIRNKYSITKMRDNYNIIYEKIINANSL